MRDRIARRGFLKSTALAPAAFSLDAAETGAPAPADVTRRLAAWVVASRPEDVPAAVRKEGARTLLNWMGCAVGGSRHPTMEAAIHALAPFCGPPQASLLGRGERFDVLTTAMLNGISSHIFDFDDTHLKTVIHPAAPVAPALLAFSEYRPVAGADLLHALIVGTEVECRIGNAVYPQHYDIGWHITGTTGPFGAAAAIARLLRLSEQQTRWALSIAATQPVGLREMFGTMTKSFHPGRAAHNGLTAAFLAERNFTSSDQPLEAPRGWANVLSTARNYRQITDQLGEHYEISLNSYKPFPCGVVIHPAVDGVLQLRAQYGIDPAAIERIELRVHPLVPELTGKRAPRTGLEGKFSIYHAVAAALIHGRLGEQEFSGRAVQDPAAVALRQRVILTVDPAVGEDQVRIAIDMKDGRRLDKFIQHAIGSAQNPMSDSQLEAKFQGLADGILPPARVRRLMDLCWNVEKLTDAAGLPRAAAA